jgi:hypothetical protein
MKVISEWLREQFGFLVYSCEFRTKHSCWTREEALEWVACYPASDRVYVWRRNRLVAVRG